MIPRRKRSLWPLRSGKIEGIKRAYFKRIDNYSSKKLSKIFLSHISNTAKVTTDITQIKSNAPDFFEVNTIIHHLKAELRSVYSWMNENHIEKYLDEYSYRLNRSIHK